MVTTPISGAGAHVAAALTDRIPASKAPFTPGTKGYLTPQKILDLLLTLAMTWTNTQTITPAVNTNALAVTGYSLTGANAQSLIDLAGTWNTSGTPSLIKASVTDTASNAASMLVDLLVGGNRKFTISKDGTADIYSGVSTNVAIRLMSTQIRVLDSGIITWSASANAISATDVRLGRDAANILAQSNGVNAQSFRVYGTLTNASNFERAAINAGADYAELAAETAGTGDDDLDVRLTPAGAGKVRFGTVTVNADAPVTGYVTIKDAAGNAVKLATIA